MVRKLIVSGPPRSGTTVLAEMLSRHDKVALTLEYDFAQIANSLHASFNQARQHQAYLDTTPMAGQAGQIDGYAELVELRIAGFADVPAWEHPRPGTLANRFERLLSAWFTEVTGKAGPVWIADKMPDVFARTALSQAMELFPALHFIYIFRNPLAMIASSMRRRANALVGQDRWEMQGLAEDIAVWLRSWEACQALIAAGHPVHVVKYEELVSQPTATMDAIFAFLDLESLPLRCRLYDTPKAVQSRYMSERDEAYVTELMDTVIRRWDEPLADLVRSAPDIPYLASRGAQLTMTDLDAFQVRALDFGFHAPDDWCRWTMASGGLKVHLFERERPTSVMIDFAAYDAANSRELVDLSVNGQSVVQIDPASCAAERNGCRLALPLPAKGRELTITLTNPRYHPADTPGSPDPRELGVALRSVTFI